MVDIAALSVVVTGVVAVSAQAALVYNGRAQRRHEAGLAFSERVWEAKSTVLLGVIRLGLALARAVEAREMTDLASGIAELHRFEATSAAEVETYSSKATRDAFRDLTALAGMSDVDPVTYSRLSYYRAMKEEAIEAQDFEEAASQRSRERALLDDIAESIAVDPPTIRDSALRLVASARKDLRDPSA